MSDDAEILREFEAEVLDRHHTTLPFWKTGSSRSWALLTGYDSFILVRYLRQERGMTTGGIQYLKSIDEGISAALRWHFEDTPTAFPEPTTTVDLGCAGEFLEFAGEYNTLSILHSMYGHNMITVECDRATRRVRFVPPAVQRIRPWYAMAERVQTESHLKTSQRPDVEWIGSNVSKLRFRFERGRIVLLEPRQLVDLGFIDRVRTLIGKELLPLPDETIFSAGFRMSSFREFWTALYAWSHCLSEIYLDSTFNGVEQARCMPTQHMTRRSFCEAMRSITGLELPEVEAIVTLLRFDPTDRKSDLFLQPFLCSADHVSWSALTVRLSRAERNLLKLMSRTRRFQAEAANLIGGRESQLLQQLGRFLAKRGGFQFRLNQKISAGGEEAEIDLLAYSVNAPEQVLVVEAKAILATDELNEQIESGRILRDEVERLDRRIRILSKMEPANRARIFRYVDWARVKSIHRLVVTPDSPPPSTFDCKSTPVVSFLTMQHSFRTRDLRSPLRICDAASERRWLQDEAVLRVDFKAVIIGNVTYEMPVDVTDV
jgi:hypothetical protein